MVGKCLQCARWVLWIASMRLGMVKNGAHAMEATTIDSNQAADLVKDAEIPVQNVVISDDDIAAKQIDGKPADVIQEVEIPVVNGDAKFSHPPVNLEEANFPKIMNSLDINDFDEQHKMARSSNYYLDDDDDDFDSHSDDDPDEHGITEKDWAEKMQNFSSNFMITQPISAQSSEYFYQDISPQEIGILVRGGYFVSNNEGQRDFNFQIKDPEGEIIDDRNLHEGIFSFQAKKSGTYEFIITNKKWMESRLVTFMIGLGDVAVLQTEHLNPLHSDVNHLLRKVKDLQGETNYLWTRQKSQMEKYRALHHTLSWYSLWQFLVLVIVSLGQVYFIKQLVLDRRVL